MPINCCWLKTLLLYSFGRPANNFFLFWPRSPYLLVEQTTRVVGHTLGWLLIYLIITMQITGHRGVICDLDCWLYLNFTVVTVHCFYAVESIVLNIECFHMTSRRPYWCPKTMKRRPCWCPKPVLWELNSFLMQTLSFVSINLHRCRPHEWKHSINQVKYYPMLRKTAEGNECGRITAAKIL